jgi:hypothetical protein
MKRKKLLPGEILTLSNQRRKSAEVIVIVDTSCEQIPQMAHENNEGLNIKMFSMQYGAVVRQ